ncbi:MAG: GNAT family N-acetyltransferase, partial [Myxococcota bacterium]
MASIVEGYVGEQLSFDALDKVTWENLRLKFGNYFEIPTCAELLCPQHKDRRYWILDAQGEPCGTMGLSLRLPWARHLIAHGLYVSPQARRCGRASTVLFAAAEAARRHGLPGLSIQTSWLWQDSLRFAMAAGFWYDRWKHEIQLVLIPDGRAWSFSLDDSSAVFEVRERGRCTLKFVARRDDTRLVLTEPGTPDSDELSSYFRALGTFSLMLALHGW